MSDDYRNLKTLIDSDRYKEKECKEYLYKLDNYLFRDKLIGSPIKKDMEYRGSSGDIDVVISGIAEDGLGIKNNEAFIWEIKAPQCHIFEVETNNRLRPSEDLVKAENQLLHYYLEQKGSQQFKDDFSIQNPKYVKIGGIIIGKNDTTIKDKEKLPQGRSDSLLSKIRDARELFYEKEGIKLTNWDTILEQFKPSQVACPASTATIEVPQEQISEGTISLTIKIK